jgi:capsular polysaccharide transport system permease protein
MDGEDSLELETAPTAAAPPGTALERLGRVSLALSDAARRRRLSGRPRAGGFGPRRGSRLARSLAIASFALVVAAPSLAAAVYYAAFAADQFVSEAEFTVSVSLPPSSGSSAPKDDGVGAATGLPLLMIIQDTQVIVSYIHSRAALDKLQDLIRIRDLYADPGADWLARFDPRKPIERFLKYWNGMAETTIEMPGGIVHLKVRAFTPDAARRIAAATVDICEQLVNDMNARMNHDAVAYAELALSRAAQRVADALAALERARNESGIVETSKSAEVINSLLKEAKTELLTLEGEYNSNLGNVLPSAPQMRQLNSRIEATRKQIGEIESKLTSPTEGDGLAGDATISQAMTKFGTLDLERGVAEQLYAGAAAALEVAKLNADYKMLYLKTFVAPEAPEEARYPKRWLNCALVFIGSLSLWGFLCGVVATIRKHLA